MRPEEGPFIRLHVGLDLSRHRFDVRVLEPVGTTVAQLTVAPEGHDLRRLAARLGGQGEVRAVFESMNGARSVHDTLELAGRDVQIADAVKVKGLAPLACKTDKIDALVLRGVVTAGPGLCDLAALPRWTRWRWVRAVSAKTWLSRGSVFAAPG